MVTDGFIHIAPTAMCATTGACTLPHERHTHPGDYKSVIEALSSIRGKPQLLRLEKAGVANHEQDFAVLP
jgi:hypothetical protein